MAPVSVPSDGSNCGTWIFWDTPVQSVAVKVCGAVAGSGPLAAEYQDL